MKIKGKILLLRYSDNHGVNTIKEHRNVIEKNGACWWAKIGKQPTDKYLKEFIEQESPQIILYTPSVIHLCEYGGLTRKRPTDQYPKYYHSDVFGENEPETYFLLKSIKEIDLSFLEDYVISVSGKEVLYDLKKTISSYMLIQHKDEPRKEKQHRTYRKRVCYTEKNANDDKTSCVYKKDGKCGNKRCISYLYECYHPDVCLKRKK